MAEIVARAGGGDVTIEIVENGIGGVAESDENFERSGAGGGYSEDTGLRDRMTAATADALVRARRTVLRVAHEFADGIGELDEERRPRELTVQFGIALTGTGNAKVVSLQSAATFSVTLKYVFNDAVAAAGSASSANSANLTESETATA